MLSVFSHNSKCLLLNICWVVGGADENGSPCYTGWMDDQTTHVTVDSPLHSKQTRCFSSACCCGVCFAASLARVWGLYEMNCDASPAERQPKSHFNLNSENVPLVCRFLARSHDSGFVWCSTHIYLWFYMMYHPHLSVVLYDIPSSSICGSIWYTILIYLWVIYDIPSSSICSYIWYPILIYL